jgi:excisionase family DNA binding protein
MPASVPLEQRISVSIDEAAAASSLSRRTIYHAIRDGLLESRRIGGRRVILVKSLRRFLGADRADRPTDNPKSAA